VIEAGGKPESYNYQVPCFHALSTEEREMAWNFFVHHYETNEGRDDKYRADLGGVLYPRAGTLGGCTAHNAMITLVPHDTDWNDIANTTKDDSWRAEKMWQYFDRVQQWLSTETVDPTIALGDKEVVKTVFSSALWAAKKLGIDKLMNPLDNPNDITRRAHLQGLTTVVPLATKNGRRNGTREALLAAERDHGLRIALNTLAVRVILDGDKRAVGVECWEGANLYRADPNAGAAPQYTKKEYRCTREVILAGGAFNTPQLLMLSGIGPKEHLADCKIECLVDRPGVGKNLQDRYEVGVVSEMKQPFALLKDATFKPPAAGESGDACFQDWLQGSGLYTSNGAMAALILKSAATKSNPDLFIFALPGDFHGYFPTYSASITTRKDHITWAILKAHTNNTNGTVRLRSDNPLDTPEINFHYFEESNDDANDDLEAVVKGVQLVRGMNDANSAIGREVIPGRDKAPDDAAVRKWIADNAWGHHASCSCKMGDPADPNAVVDSRFRVIGAKNLRIVDASVFPHIPGFFIVTPIYMISEKAADTIAGEA
jgi:choline dehydrogenase